LLSELSVTNVIRSDTLLTPQFPGRFSKESNHPIDGIQVQTALDSKDSPTNLAANNPQPVIDHEQLFAWLGILAKNAAFTAQTAATLWQMSVDEVDALLRHWLAEQRLTSGRWPQADQSPTRQTYQISPALHAIAYQNLIQNSNLTVQQAHATVIDHYRAQTHKQLWHTLADDGYIHAHLTWHLQAANLGDEIHILLQEEAESGANGWYEACDRQGYTTFFCRDVNLAWQLAEEMYGQAPTQAMQLQCRYALMTVAHQRAVTRIPGNLVAAFVSHQVWPPTQSITYLELIQDPQHQFDVLQDLIPVLPLTYHAYILNAIKRQSHCGHQARLLCILAPRLDPKYYPELLKIVQDIDTDRYRAMVLQEIVVTLPTSLLDQTLAIVTTLSPTAAMVAACGIVTRWPQTIPHYLERLTDVAQDNIEDESIYADLLRAIISIMSDSHLPEILELINILPDPVARVDLLSQLLPQYPQLFSVGFQTACTITNEQSCALALGKIAPFLGEVDVQLALNIIEKFEDPSAFRLALQFIVTHHPASSVGAKLIRMIDTLSSASAQCQAFCQIFPHLPLSVQATIKIRIDACTDRKAQAIARCHLAITDKSMLSSALHAISQCPDSQTPFAAYWILSQRWPKLFPAALKAACQIVNIDRQVLAFHQLAPHLPQTQLKEVLAIANQTQNQHHRQKILDAIIPYCSKSLLVKIRNLLNKQTDHKTYAALLGTLKAQLTSSELNLNPSDARQRALRSLTSFLPDDLLQQSLAAIFDFADQGSCANSLSRLLPQIHPGQVDYPLWCKILHTFTHLEHDLFFLSIPKWMPFLYQLAGPEIHHGMIQNIQLINRQW